MTASACLASMMEIFSDFPKSRSAHGTAGRVCFKKLRTAAAGKRETAPAGWRARPGVDGTFVKTFAGYIDDRKLQEFSLASSGGCHVILGPVNSII
jgi:hypothetical protein